MSQLARQADPRTRVLHTALLACGGLLAGCAAPAPSPHRDLAPMAVEAASARAESAPAASQETSAGDAAELAKKLSNPVASLTTVPLQLNYDEDIGPADGERWTLNVQPVIPISLNEDWNLISRTIVPLIDQQGLPVLGADETGLGDVVQSLFFSPVEPTSGGWIWGAGPVLLLPTASDETLGAEQWGLGPTVVVLKQQGRWTYGGLVNHLWSVAGEDDRADVNATFIQPFLSYTTPTAWTFGLNAESTYDWESEDLAVPANLTASKVLKFGDQLVQLGGGVRYWVEESDVSPEEWGLRFNLVFLFPK